MGNCAIIIQARLSSERFPGKVLEELNGIALIEYVYKRCMNSSVKNILIATSDEGSDDALYFYCKDKGLTVMRGSLNNVLERYIRAAELFGIRHIVRVCADSPFVDVSLMDTLLQILVKEGLDYVSVDRETCVAGFLSEAITLEALKKSLALAKTEEELEHVTKFIIDNSKEFKTKFIDAKLNPEFVKGVKLTVDYPGDIVRANLIVEDLQDKFNFSSKDVLDVVSHKMGLC